MPGEESHDVSNRRLAGAPTLKRWLDSCGWLPRCSLPAAPSPGPLLLGFRTQARGFPCATLRSSWKLWERLQKLPRHQIPS